MLKTILRWLKDFWSWICSLFKKKGDGPIRPPWRPPPISGPTLELIGLPGHGKTSYIWALLQTLRRLDLLLPGYACWPQDEQSGDAILATVEAVAAGRLPAKEVGDLSLLKLELRRIEPYGTRVLSFRDRHDDFLAKLLRAPKEGKVRVENDLGTGEPKAASGAPPADEVASPASADKTEAATPKAAESEKPASDPDLNWHVPVCWLLSLADLENEEAAVLDLLLDSLIQRRRKSGHSDERPMRLIVALTKADRLSNLPAALRNELKGDPTWAAMAGQNENPMSSSPMPRDGGGDANYLRAYVERLWTIHLLLTKWFGSTLTGHRFLERAKAHFIEVRFAMVSATGGAAFGMVKPVQHWQPRRVLDPVLLGFDFELPQIRLAEGLKAHP
jgi:hypothetical protein